MSEIRTSTFIVRTCRCITPSTSMAPRSPLYTACSLACRDLAHVGAGGMAPGVRPFRFGCAAAAMRRDMITDVSLSFGIFGHGPIPLLTLHCIHSTHTCCSGLISGPGGGLNSSAGWGSLGAAVNSGLYYLLYYSGTFLRHAGGMPIPVPRQMRWIRPCNRPCR